VTDKPYSFGSARRNLQHFAIGRILVGLTGVVLLLLTVRRLPPSDFGAYISLVALIDIVGFATSFGLFGFAQRYVPEYRIHATHPQLVRAIGVSILGRIGSLLFTSLVLAVLASEVCQMLSLPVAARVFQIFCIVLLLDGTIRFVDQLFESLLMQAGSQITSLARSLVKLCGLLLMFGADDWHLADIVYWDLVAATVATVLALSILARGVMAIPQRATASRDFDRPLMLKVSFFNYVALLTSQFYGFDALKLMVSKFIGIAATAAYGFAQSIADIVRRYLPAYLLLGMIRPLIVASFANSNDYEKPLVIANVVLKLNAFLIAPVLAVAIALGEPLLELIAKGRYPEAHGYVILFIVLLLLQTWHTMLSLLAMTAERNDLIMKGTLFAVSGAGVALVVIPSVGAYGALLAAFASELAYCTTVSRGLRPILRRPAIQWPDFLTIAGVFAATLVFGCLAASIIPRTLETLLGQAIAIGLLFLVAAYIWKPFSESERGLINRFLPRPLFCW
jgi:O-antigen/teichoic acid export membrane protein